MEWLEKALDDHEKEISDIQSKRKEKAQQHRDFVKQKCAINNELLKHLAEYFEKIGDTLKNRGYEVKTDGTRTEMEHGIKWLSEVKLEIKKQSASASLKIHTGCGLLPGSIPSAGIVKNFPGEFKEVTLDFDTLSNEALEGIAKEFIEEFLKRTAELRR